MPEQDEAAKKAAEEKAKADAEAKEAKKKADADAKKKVSQESTAKEPRKVMVICEGTLGHKLLQKGDITDDPEYVALLDDKTGRGKTLVKEVK